MYFSVLISHDFKVADCKVINVALLLESNYILLSLTSACYAKMCVNGTVCTVCHQLDQKPVVLTNSLIVMVLNSFLTAGDIFYDCLFRR